MTSFRYVVVDVFTNEALAGNQLAVFTDARDIPESQLQRLAKEMNFSETTFVYPPEDGGHVKMRIFTPASEIPFAGHPTLGTAFVLAGPLQLLEIRIECGSGTVPVRVEREGARIVFGRMEQPLPTVALFERADELQAVLGVESELPVEVYDNGLRHVYVQYFGKPPAPGAIHLYTAYNNRECLHCHLRARSFEESPTHAAIRDQLVANQISCLTSGCHDVVHNVAGLENVKFWKGAP